VLTAFLIAAALSCPDPAILDQQLDDTLVALRPGLSLDEVAVLTKNPREWLVPVRGKVFVMASAVAGRRVASMALSCGYSEEKLQTCTVAGRRAHKNFIERSGYERIQIGQSIGSVLAAFCLPEQVEMAADGSVTFSYSTSYPFEAYLPFGTASFTFSPDGRLRQKIGPELDSRITMR
jgi:hypothetical protein